MEKLCGVTPSLASESVTPVSAGMVTAFCSKKMSRITISTVFAL